MDLKEFLEGIEVKDHIQWGDDRKNIDYFDYIKFKDFLRGEYQSIKSIGEQQLKKIPLGTKVRVSGWNCGCEFDRCHCRHPEHKFEYEFFVATVGFYGESEESKKIRGIDLKDKLRGIHPLSNIAALDLYGTLRKDNVDSFFIELDFLEANQGEPTPYFKIFYSSEDDPIWIKITE